MKKLIITLSIALVLLPSCATILTGTKQNVRINSIPEGAKIEINGAYMGITPAKIKLRKAYSAPIISLKKEGFETKSFSPTQTLQLISLLNLLDPIAWGIDALTCSLKKYSPGEYTIELEPKSIKNAEIKAENE
jgi:hypothetical protein